MFIPLRDKNPLRIVPFQFVTLGLMALCIAVFIWQTGLSASAQNDVAYAFGLIPAVLFGLAVLPPDLAEVPAEVTLVSYMFLHGNWWHLIGNMLFLWVFGDNIEDSMGHWRYAVFFLLCGIAAGFLHGAAAPSAQAPVIGASGAVSGIIGAYMVLHPRVRLLALVFGRIPVYLPAWMLILVWLAYQFFSAYWRGGDTAWWVHIGGFIVGAVLVIPFRYKHIPLLDRGVAH